MTHRCGRTSGWTQSPLQRRGQVQWSATRIAKDAAPHSRHLTPSLTSVDSTLDRGYDRRYVTWYLRRIITVTAIILYFLSVAEMDGWGSVTCEQNVILQRRGLVQWSATRIYIRCSATLQTSHALP